MDKTFDILNDKALAVFDDRLPVVFKYNGETLRRLSALTKNVNNSETNANEVSYTSEYNRSLRSLGVSGNTTQKSYGGYQLIPLKDGRFSETDSDGNVLSWEIKDGIVTVNGKWNKFRVLSLDHKNYGYTYFEAGTYTYTTAYYQGEGFPSGGLSCDWKFNLFDEAGAQTNTTGWTNTKTRTVEAQTFAHRFRIQHIQVYIQGNTEYTNFRYAPALFKGAVTSTDIPPYEPYVGGIPSPNPTYPQKIENANNEGMSITLHGDNFREEIAIPTSVEVEGATVDLNMASITVDGTLWGGTVRQATDKLVVNRVENKVKYKKEVNRIVFDGTEEFVTNYPFSNSYQIDVLANDDGSQCFCSHFTTNETEETYVEINTGHLRFYTNFETLETFIEWVKEQYANGTPLTVEYALDRPITHDITNTELGNLILDLTNKIPYGTIYLEVNSGLSVPITVDYAKWGGANE